MEYKKAYTKEEAEELVAWYDANMDMLDTSVDVNKCTSVANVEYTYRSLRNLILTKYENVTFSSYIHLLYQIRDILVEKDK